MIHKINVGKFYNIVGVGVWEGFTIDVKVVGITTSAEVEGLNIDLYGVWFKTYEIAESVYKDLIKENCVIYHCKTIDSRNPKVLKESGDDVYIFPALINYNASSELFECVSYYWELWTHPYKERDPLNPNNLLPKGVQLKSIINEAIRPYMYDSFLVAKTNKYIIVSEAEYDKFTAVREKTHQAELAKKHTIDTELEKRLSYMYGVVESTKAKEEELHTKQIEADNYMREAVRLHQTNQALQQDLATKETRLRTIHRRLSYLLDDIQEYMTDENRIVLPPFNELL
jgi:hypothetical protein